MSELELPGIEGRVIRNGVAQTVEHDGDRTRIKLSVFTELAQALSTVGPAGAPLMTQVELPEPVTVPGGSFVCVEMEWLPGPEREEASQPVHVASDATIT